MLPELASPRAFHTWLQQQVSKGREPLDILAELEAEPSELSLCRQMNVAHLLNLPDVRDKKLEACLACFDQRVEAFAIGLLTYRRIARHDSADISYNTAAFNVLPMLRGVLDDLLERHRDPFSREVEAILRVSIGLAHFYQKEFEPAAREASKATFWLTEVGALYYTTRAKSLLISIYGESGQMSSTLKLLEEELQNATRPLIAKRFHERVYAIMLYMLGQNVAPLDVLRDAQHLDEGDQRPISSELQRLQVLLGIGGLEGEVIRAAPTYAYEIWITESMRCLIRAAAMPKTTQNMEKRNALLARAVDVRHEDRRSQMIWHSVLGQWVTGLAQLKLGKTSLAISATKNIDLTNRQWLDLRLLIAGLRLEVALHINHPEESVERPYEALVSVFEDARQLPLASPEGLADRLIHWHPLAAAYAAVAPNPIVELRTATRAVMRLGAANTVYDKSLPPAYAAELVLRALDYDLRPSPKFIQAELGSSRLKRNSLFTQYGDVSYWRPCLSAVSLIYGLVKAGHIATAQAVFHEFGVSPYSTAEYAMLSLVDHVRTTTSKLLAGQIDPKIFSTLLLNFD